MSEQINPAATLMLAPISLEIYKLDTALGAISSCHRRAGLEDFLIDDLEPGWDGWRTLETLEPRGV